MIEAAGFTASQHDATILFMNFSSCGYTTLYVSIEGGVLTKNLSF